MNFNFIIFAHLQKLKKGNNCCKFKVEFCKGYQIRPQFNRLVHKVEIPFVRSDSLGI